DSRDLHASTKTARCRTPLQSFRLPRSTPALYHRRERHSRRALHLSNCNYLAGPYHRAERGTDLFPVAEISRKDGASRSRLVPPKPNQTNDSWQIYSQESHSPG